MESISSVSPVYLFLAGAAVTLHLLRSRPKVPLPPGPPADPLIGHIRTFPTKDKEATLHEWSKQYGDVMSFNLLGQTVVVLDSHEAAMELLEKRSSLYSSRSGAAVFTIMGVEPNIMTLPYGPDFRKHRRLLSPALTREAIREFERTQQENAVILTDHLIKDKGVNLEHYLAMFATSVIIRISTGYQVLSEKDKFIKIAEDIQQAMQETGIPGATPIDWFPFLQYLPSWFPGTHYANVGRKWNYAIRNLYDYPFDLVRKQMDEGTADYSFLLRHLQAMGSDLDSRDVDHVKGAAAALYAGGSETTWTAMSSFFLAMTVYPECQKVAQDEIDRVVGKDRLPSFEDRDALPYVSAVVQETLRWGRISPLGVPHRSTHDDIYRGMFIPKGTLVIANIYGLSVEEKRYSNPKLFNPKRFLPRSMGGNDEPPFEGVFGFGRRICPGRHLAAASLWIAVATVLSTLDIGKVKDENGVEITPEVGFETGLNRYEDLSATALSHPPSSIPVPVYTMATVIETPGTSSAPRRRRRESIEIIDVDLLDEQDIATLQRPLRRRRPNPPHPETIVLIDSDDDEPIITSSTNRHPPRGSRLRSLPPPPPFVDIPPVPPIPRQFAGQSSMLHRRQLPLPRGVIRPNTQPFAFEEQMGVGPSIRRGNSNAPPGPPPAAPLPPAPPSHHVPSMGFGGAILQINHEAASQDRRRRGSRPTTRARHIHHLFMPIMEDLNDNFLFEPRNYPDVDVFMRLMHFGQNPEARNKEPEYLPTYTHPAKPEPGFVCDFAPDNAVSDKATTSYPATSSENPIVITDDEPSTSSSVVDEPPASTMQTLLVCACCSKPLLLNSQTSNKGLEEEHKRRIWALRCGHLIDGECLDKISMPVIPSSASTSRGKTKANHSDDEFTSGHVSDSDWDGLDLLPAPRYSLRRHHPIPDYDTFLTPSGYPLRSRPLEHPLSPPLHRQKRHQSSSAKKGKKKQETFEWPCPVPGCERMHVSVRDADGGWDQEKDSVVGRGKTPKAGRGAIAVFPKVTNGVSAEHALILRIVNISVSISTESTFWPNPKPLIGPPVYLTTNNLKPATLEYISVTVQLDGSLFFSLLYHNHPPQAILHPTSYDSDMIYYSLVLAALTLLNGTLAAVTPGDSAMSAMSQPANRTLIIQESPERRFSAFLPTAHQETADRVVGSSNAERYCSEGAGDCKMFPEGCLKEKQVTYKAPEGVHGNYTQFSAEIDPETCGMKPEQYVQYHTNAPPGSRCAGWPEYVEILDAKNRQLCVRCCARAEDCQVRVDATCEQALGGNYFGAQMKKP
ncbi:hypothetical protein ONZ45_g2484 [Pleurotus djamor]|nr:hypothetical protein ONZ45_g2484 [Pleurotus djamor]